MLHKLYTIFLYKRESVPAGALPFETVKKPAVMKDNRAAGELEGARPASSWINRRPESLDFSRLSG